MMQSHEPLHIDRCSCGSPLQKFQGHCLTPNPPKDGVQEAC